MHVDGLIKNLYINAALIRSIILICQWARMMSDGGQTLGQSRDLAADASQLHQHVGLSSPSPLYLLSSEAVCGALPQWAVVCRVQQKINMSISLFLMDQPSRAQMHSRLTWALSSCSSGFYCSLPLDRNENSWTGVGHLCWESWNYLSDQIKKPPNAVWWYEK